MERDLSAIKARAPKSHGWLTVGCLVWTFLQVLTLLLGCAWAYFVLMDPEEGPWVRVSGVVLMIFLMIFLVLGLLDRFGKYRDAIRSIQRRNDD